MVRRDQASHLACSVADSILWVVTIKRRNTGGIVITRATGITLTKIDEKMVRTILQSYKMHVSQFPVNCVTQFLTDCLSERGRADSRRHLYRRIHRCGARESEVRALHQE
jgi:hypothetical protein